MQAVVQDVGSAVGQQRVALHLSEADAAAELAALDGLLSELVVGACRSDLRAKTGQGK